MKIKELLKNKSLQLICLQRECYFKIDNKKRKGIFQGFNSSDPVISGIEYPKLETIHFNSVIPFTKDFCFEKNKSFIFVTDYYSYTLKNIEGRYFCTDKDVKIPLDKVLYIVLEENEIQNYKMKIFFKEKPFDVKPFEQKVNFTTYTVYSNPLVNSYSRSNDVMPSRFGYRNEVKNDFVKDDLFTFLNPKLIYNVEVGNSCYMGVKITACPVSRKIKFSDQEFSFDAIDKLSLQGAEKVINFIKKDLTMYEGMPAKIKLLAANEEVPIRFGNFDYLKKEFFVYHKQNLNNIPKGNATRYHCSQVDSLTFFETVIYKKVSKLELIGDFRCGKIVYLFYKNDNGFLVKNMDTLEKRQFYSFYSFKDQIDKLFTCVVKDEN